MNTQLDLIQSSPNPIRSSWDEDKMQGLTDSIKEQGLIVPIKVRPVSDFLDLCPFHGYRRITDDGPRPSEHREDDCNIGDCSYCSEIMEWIWPSYVDEDGCTIEPWNQQGDVPPKRRPFEIVYGHRRAEACRRANMTEIEVIIDGVDDTNAIIQAWIENAQREDMSALDRARALRSIKEATEWSNKEMERRGIAPNPTISKLLAYLGEYESGAVPLLKKRQGAEGVERATQIKTAFGKVGIDDPALKRRVHEHTAALPNEKMREVAEAVAHAEDEAEREAILTTDPADPSFDRLVKTKAAVKRKAERQNKKKRQEDPREVKTYLDAVQTYSAAIQEAIAVAQFGKFSPEAMRFVTHWHESLRTNLEALENAMREYHAQVQE